VFELRNQVLASAREAPLRHLISASLLNDYGKVIGRRPGMMGEDPDEQEKAMRAHMFEHAGYTRAIYAQGIIEPARRKIVADHGPRQADLLSIIAPSPLIPPGREHLWAQGFHAGFDGDFVVAGHLLIPQFEESLRCLLRQRGVITSGLDSQGVQDEKGLNAIVYFPEVKDIFGEDNLFDLQGLLVERPVNLRNRVAHGLLEQGGFYSNEMVYLWWLLLRLCVLPLLPTSNTPPN
jgi:hypothetical protein